MTPRETLAVMDVLTVSYPKLAVSGFDVKKTLDYAMAAGIAAVSHERTINPNMSTALLEEILLAHRI